MSKIIIVIFAICFVLMVVHLLYIYFKLNRLLILIMERDIKYWSKLGYPYCHFVNLGGKSTIHTMAALRFGFAAIFGSHLQEISHDETVLKSYGEFRRIILTYSAIGISLLSVWLIFIASVITDKNL